MQREPSFEHDQRRSFADRPARGDSLDQHRVAIDAMLHSSDHLFNLIDPLLAQQYLEQRRQICGQ